MQTLGLQEHCIVYLFELLYTCDPHVMASHHQEESELKPYKNNYINNSDKNRNNIFDPNGQKQIITKHSPNYDKKRNRNYWRHRKVRTRRDDVSRRHHSSQ